MAHVSPEELAHEIHAQDTRLVIAVTGGGSGAISALLGVPGASRSVLAATVPYAPEVLREWIGAKPDEFCSSGTARAMAMQSYLKAHGYDPAATVCGVGCTASLASDRPKRGAHRAHLAFQTAAITATVSVELEKGRRTRAEEEAIVTLLVLNLIAEASGAPGRVDVPLAPHESLQARQIVAPADQQALLAARTLQVPLGAARQQPAPRAVMPGAFHPLHQAHQRMAELAGQILGQQVAYEISIVNVDKPPLDFIEIDERARQFSAATAVWLTRAAHFMQKAEIFPGATFVVGVDTIARIAQARYYGDDPLAMEAAFAKISAQGCRFLVFGRAMDGDFLTLGDLQLPPSLTALCQQVPETAFRDDISSTQLRQQDRTP